MTQKQKLFADEYFLHGDAKQAAIKAGYQLLNNPADRLLSAPSIVRYLEQRQAENDKKYAITPDMVIKELTKIAFSNVNNYYHPDGSVKQLQELNNDEIAAIDVYEVNDVYGGTGDNKRKIGQKVTLKLHNRAVALDKLTRYFGIQQPDKSKNISDEPFDFSKYVDPEDLDIKY